EKRPGPEADGFIPWTVVLHTSTLGKHALGVRWTEPLSLDKADTPRAELKLKLVRPQGVERENGEIVVLKDRVLAIEDKFENLEPIDPRQRTPLPAECAALDDVKPRATSSGDADGGDDEVQLAYRYYRHPVDLTLTAAKHQIQRVVETVVSRALVDAVVPERGPVTYRAQLLLRSSQRQRLRVVLPTGARFLAVTVAGRNVLPERDAPAGGAKPEAAGPTVGMAPPPQGAAGDSAQGEAYLLNVSRASDAAEPFPMTIVYEHADADVAAGLVQRTFEPHAPPNLALFLPRLEGDVSYSRLYWRVWLPRWYTVLNTPADWTDENKPINAFLNGVAVGREVDGAIGQWQAEWNTGAGRMVYDFAMVGRPFLFSSLSPTPYLEVGYGYVPSMTLAASAAAFLFFFLTRWFGAEVKFTLLLGVTLAVVVGGLYAGGVVYRWASAAEWGVGLGLLSWLMRSILVGQRKRAAARAAKVAAAKEADARLAANMSSDAAGHGAEGADHAS
ncbi:MAG: hypothetical protein ACRC1K_22950, partial [Planctomycetia bacterium]